MTTLLWLIRTAITSGGHQPFVLDKSGKEPVEEVCQIAMEQANRRMHQYFAIDQIRQDTWFQPVEELIRRPEFVCDRSGRWHENANKEIDYRPILFHWQLETADLFRTVVGCQCKGSEPLIHSRYADTPA